MNEESSEKVKVKPITISEARELLGKIDLELADRLQKRALEYTIKFSKLSVGEAVRLRGELVEKIGLTEFEAVELLDIMPLTLGELRTITLGWKKILPTEKLEEILSILKSAERG